MATPTQQSGNPPMWDEAEQAMAQRYVQQAANNSLLHTTLLTSLEQGIAFASAHLDQLKSLAAQLRSIVGA